MADVDDARAVAQELRDFFDGLDRRRQPDALRLRALDQRIQPRQRQRQVRAALVVGHGMDLVHDHGPRGAQHAPRAFRGQQNEQRFRRGDQDVRRLLAHLLPLPHRRVAGAHGGADGREQDALFGGQRGDLGQRRLQVLADVVAERFERRDVDDRGLVRERSFTRRAHQAVEADAETPRAFCRSRWARRSEHLARREFPASRGFAVRWARKSAA